MLMCCPSHPASHHPFQSVCVWETSSRDRLNVTRREEEDARNVIIIISNNHRPNKRITIIIPLLSEQQQQQRSMTIYLPLCDLISPHPSKWYLELVATGGRQEECLGL